MDEYVFEAIRSALPMYRGVTREELRLAPMRSGTNKVFKAEAPGLPPLIFRKFGSASTINRESEHSTFLKIASAGLGPSCLATGPGFRIEEFLPGDALPRKALCEVVEPLAMKLAKIHALESGNGESCTATNIRRWSSMMVETLPMLRDHLTPEKRSIIDDLISSAISETPSVLSLFPANTPLVLSHNDVSYTNILRHESTIHLIDFEYAGLNYRAADLANAANEAVYEYNAPAPEYFRVCWQDEFSKERLSTFVETYCGAAGISDDEIWRDFYKCQAAIHFSSFVWAACTFSAETEEWYDFLGYSRSRLRCYRETLDKLP